MTPERAITLGILVLIFLVVLFVVLGALDGDAAAAAIANIKA